MSQPGTPKYFFKIYLFILRGGASGGGTEREGEREKIPSRLHTVSAESDVGLDLADHEITT